MSILVNIKRASLIAVSVAVSLNTLSVNLVQARSGDASRARQEAIHAQMIQCYQSQIVNATATNAANVWQSVSAAPHDFPVPVFSGAETTFMMPRAPQGIPGMPSVSQMVLRTKDSPTAINQFYQIGLQRAGLTLDQTGPRIQTVGYRMLRAQSDKMTCNILIYGRESGEFDTTINITTVKKDSTKQS